MKVGCLRAISLLLLSSACLLAGLPAANAAPVFARKYGFNCTMCHSNFPRLNDFGQRYRNNGYQLPGREDDEQTVLEGPAPIAGRTSAGYNYDKFKNVEEAEDINQFQLNGLDLLSGGLIARNIGYFAIYVPEIQASSGVAGQTGALEMANVVFSNVGRTNTSVRVGRFEGAFVPFSAKRILTFSPYEIYDFAGPGGLALSDTQTGIEISGGRTHGLRYALGWTDGSASNRSDDSPADLYVRLAKVFGEGEGQTAGHRLGLVGYWGDARPADETMPDTGRHSVDRWGVDAVLNFREWSLGLQYMQGSDDAALWGGSGDYDISGGFAEALYMPATNLVGFGRYDWVNTPDGPGSDVKRWTLGGRYYFADNLALHLEYSHRTQDLIESPQAKEEFFTTRLDWAF